MGWRRRPGDDRTWGMRITEAFLPFYGPAQIGSPEPQPISDADRAREADLQQRFERVTGPDGHAYVVERVDRE